MTVFRSVVVIICGEQCISDVLDLERRSESCTSVLANCSSGRERISATWESGWSCRVSACSSIDESTACQQQQQDVSLLDVMKLQLTRRITRSTSVYPFYWLRSKRSNQIQI